MGKIKYGLLLIFSMLVVILLTYFLKNQFQKQRYAVIEFGKMKHDFDTLQTQAAATAYFTYQNTGNIPLKIHKITTSCGCTIPVWNKKELSVHQIDSFKVNYNTQNKGAFLKEIMVYSNSKTSPDHLSVSGYVPYEYEK